MVKGMIRVSFAYGVIFMPVKYLSQQQFVVSTHAKQMAKAADSSSAVFNYFHV
jgi:hypothetical protein